jgi:hypothetical protein
MQRVQVLLKSLMLRRQKDSLVDGQIVCALPPKHLSKECVGFSDEEHALYKALETRSQLQLNKYLEKGTLSGECRMKYERRSCCLELFAVEQLQSNDITDAFENRLTLDNSKLCKRSCLTLASSPSLLSSTSYQRSQPACH